MSQNRSKKTIAIIVPNFNGARHLRRFFRSLQLCTLKEWVNIYVLVVDDASTDESLNEVSYYAKVLERKSIKVIIVKNKHRKGYIKSVNVGCNIVLSFEPDLIIVSNNDLIILSRDFFLKLARLAKYCNKNPYVAVFGFRIINLSPRITIPPLLRKHPSHWISLFLERTFYRKYAYIKYPILVEHVPGPIFALCKRVLREHNPIYDEIFSPGYFEETDLFRRLVMKGYKIIYYPFIEVMHLGSASFGKQIIRKEYIILRNNLIYILKHYGIIALIFEYFITSFILMFNSLKYLKIIKNTKDSILITLKVLTLALKHALIKYKFKCK